MGSKQICNLNEVVSGPPFHIYAPETFCVCCVCYTLPCHYPCHYQLLLFLSRIGCAVGSADRAELMLPLYI